jgi:hypothetical protein
MSKNMNCPCCGANSGEAHSQDCALTAYLSAGGWTISRQAEPAVIDVGKYQPFTEPGYDMLAHVLERAFNQAARGKGRERHAQGEPFQHQVMQDGARRFGVGALLFQAFKKSEESQRLPTDRGVAELLGAIVYLAGAVIAREREAQSIPTTN